MNSLAVERFDRNKVYDPSCGFHSNRLTLCSMNNDSNQSILHSAARFTGGTFISRLTGLVRDIAMAFAFGTQESVAALFVAYRLAHLLRRILGEGAMQTALVPHFEELRNISIERACRFFANLYGAITAFLVGIIFVTMIGLGAAMTIWNLSPENREIILLLIILMPSLLFICLYGLNAALLQCEKQYGLASMAPIGFNLAWTIGALLLWKMQSENAMPLLAGFIVIGTMVQWMITVPNTFMILKNGIEHPWYWESKDLFRFGKPLLLAIMGVTATQINNALDAVFARYADLQGPAELWYAIRLQQLPLAMFGIALSTALLPPLSRAYKQGDLDKYQKFLGNAVKLCLIVMIPMSVGIFLFGDSGVHLLYGRGDFDRESTISVTWSLWGYTLGLIPMSLVLLFAPACYAKGDFHSPMRASVAAVIVNVVLNTILVMVLGMGVVSVAVATSVSAWVNLAMLSRASDLQTDLLRIVGITFAAGAISYLLTGSHAFSIIKGFEIFYPTGFWEQAIQLFVQVGLYSGLYTGLVYLSNNKMSFNK